MELEDYLLTSCKSSQQFSVCLWDHSTLNVQKQYKNGGVVTSKCLELLGGDYILGAEEGKPLLHLWPLNSQDVAKNIRLILPEPAACLAVCPKNCYLAVGVGSKVYIWHISSGNLLSVQKKHYQPVTCMKFSNDSEFLVIGGLDGMIVTYRLSEMLSLTTNFQTQDNLGEIQPVYIKNDHNSAIRDMHIGCFSKKSRFATVSADHSCHIYNLIDGELLLNLTFAEPLTTVLLDHTCMNIYIAKETSFSIAMYPLQHPPRTLLHYVEKNDTIELLGHKKKVTCLDINSSGILASGSEDNFVFIWDVASRQILKEIEHKAPITNVKFVFKLANFAVEHFKPKLVLKGLERSLEGKEDLSIVRVQTEDIELSEQSEDEGNFEEIIAENRKLRIVNRQLYLAALEISKKYNVDRK